MPQTLLDGSPNRLLEITVNGTVLTPRRRFGSVPYAFTSRSGNGDITAVNAGAGHSGGGTVGDVMWSLDTGTVDNRYVNEDQANAISSAMIQNGSIDNADISTTAAIAGTKIDPNNGSQNVVTTGNVSIGRGNSGIFSEAAKYLTLSASETYTADRTAALGRRSPKTEPFSAKRWGRYPPAPGSSRCSLRCHKSKIPPLKSFARSFIHAVPQLAR